MSDHSQPAGGTDLPFPHKSVVTIMHAQNIICSKALIYGQLFAGHMVSSQPVKRKEKNQMIIRLVVRCLFMLMLLYNLFTWSTVQHNVLRFQ